MPSSLEPIYVNLSPSDSDTALARLSYKERIQIKALRDLANMTYRNIQEVVSHPRSTIQRACNLPATPQKPRRKHIINTPAKDRLVRFIESSAEARRMTFAELIASQGLECSSSTIRRVLRGVGFRRCLAIPKPWLTDTQKMDRLDWALEHAHWEPIDWARVVFTDKAAIQNGGTKRLFITRRAGEEFIPECLRPRFRKPAYCMVWGAIMDNKRGPLLIWDKKNLGNMTAKGFVDHILPVSTIEIWSALPLISV